MEVLPETVASLAARLEASPEAAAVCPMLVTPSGEPVSRIRRLPSPKELYRAWRDGDFPDWSIPDTSGDCLVVEYLKPLAIMVRANFLKGMRYIDERYGNSWWDLEVCHQIRRGAKKILLLPEVQVILHPWEDFTGSLPAGARALFSADSAMCAATFAGKHFGLGAGLKLRFFAAMQAFLQAMLALVRLRDAGYHFSRLNYLLSGQKLDGSQRIF
jgi:hypothetical protein